MHPVSKLCAVSKLCSQLTLCSFVCSLVAVAAHTLPALLSLLSALFSLAHLCSAGVELCLRASFPLHSSSLAAEEEEEEEEKEKGGAVVAVVTGAEEGDRKKTDSCWLVGCWFLAWWLLLLMLRFHLFVCLFFSCSRSSVSLLPSVCLSVCVFFHALGLLFPCFRLSVFVCVCVFFPPSALFCL